MAKVEIELNSAGVRELLNDEGIVSLCTQKANEVANGCNGTFEVTTKKGSNRTWAVVSTADKDTFFRQRATNEIIKKLGGMSQ